VLALVALACVSMLAFGLYLQHVVGLEPCPMCIVQRYALVLVAVVAGLTAAFKSRGALLAGAGLMTLFAGFGAFVAARQSWLQWYPPETASCGRDFYGMIETFPLKRAIGVIYLPQSERASHYFHTRLPAQFDAMIHIDQTRALQPLVPEPAWHAGETAETYPTGL
jgi:disulfide bond formation protein DsbB